jgi:hypothetical protein
MIPELVAKTFMEYRSQLENHPESAFGWASLASACMAEAAWLVDRRAPPEKMFEYCCDGARQYLEDRAGRLLAKVSAGDAQS